MNTDLIIDLDGSQQGELVEWEDFEVMATFENGNAQPNITVNTELTFVNEYAELIRNWIASGKITEGMPISFTATDSASSYQVFNGVIDFTDGLRIIDPTTVKATIKPCEGLNRLDERANGLTFQYLHDIGVISNSDFINIPYVIDKEYDFVDFALIAISIYLMIQQLRQIIADTASLVAEITAHAAGGVTGSIAATAYAIAKAAINLVLASFLLVAIVNAVSELISMLYSPVKFHKGIRLQTLLVKAANHLGYGYNSTIDEISNNEIVILPSKREIIQDDQYQQLISNVTVNQPGLGIPSTEDYGYTFAELIDLVNRTFAAKIAIKDGNIEQHALNSPWWIQNSSFTLPDILIEQIQYNINELSGTRLVRFETDATDYHTIENFDSTVTQITTTQPSFNNSKNILIKGFDEARIPYSLGNRKNGLTELEKQIKVLAKFTDDLTANGFFGNNGTSFESKITARVGMLKLSQDWFSIPKMMKMNSFNKLDSNHRAKWGSRFLWDNFHNYYSFTNGTTNQWEIFEDIEIPLGFNDFLSLIENSYFYTLDGREGKVEKLIWSPNRDVAKLSFRIRSKYTTNLNEDIQ